MAIVQLFFSNSSFPVLNVSIQPTDIVYACLVSTGQAGTNHPSANIDTKPFAIGKVVDNPPPNHYGGFFWMDTNPSGGTPPDYPPTTLTTNHYIFFSKDKRANMSGILGYYALVEYRNHAKGQVEMFATGTEFAPSSK